MRALGPGSVSSFLKVILDVVYAVAWAALALLVAMTLAAALLAINPGLAETIGLPERMSAQMPGSAGLAFAFSINLAGVQIIISNVRQVFATLTAGDPFHPANVRRLRIIGAVLAGMEVGRYAYWISATWFFAGATRPPLSPTAWFSVLTVFVLAEVFREGARLRREAELTI